MDTRRKLRCTRKSSNCQATYPGFPYPEPSFESVEEPVKVVVDDNGHTVTCYYNNTRNTQMVCNYPPKEESIEIPEPIGPVQSPPYPYPTPGRPTVMPGPVPIGPKPTTPYPGIPDGPIELGTTVGPPTLIPNPDEESDENSVTIIHNGGTTVYCSKRNLQVICNNYQAPNHFDKAVALSRGSQRFLGLGAIASWVGSSTIIKGMTQVIQNYSGLKDIAKDVYHAGKETFNWLLGKKDQTQVNTDVMECTKNGHARSLWRSMTRHQKQKDCTFAFDYDAVARNHGYAHCTLKPHACKEIQEIGEAVEKPKPPPMSEEQDESAESPETVESAESDEYPSGATDPPSFEQPGKPVYPIPNVPSYPGLTNNMVCNFRTKSGRNVIMACNYYNKNK